MRFELTTPTLARLCSTTELRPLAPSGEPVDQGRRWKRSGLLQTPPRLARPGRTAPEASGSSLQKPSFTDFSRRLLMWSLGASPGASGGGSPLK